MLQQNNSLVRRLVGLRRTALLASVGSIGITALVSGPGLYTGSNSSPWISTAAAAEIRGWMGVRIQEVTADIADSLGLKKAEGALVAEPQSGSPAAKAGILAGDVPTAVSAIFGSQRHSGQAPPRTAPSAHEREVVEFRACC